ncbi:hypothetical protein pipiens_006773, partial [Culex pipiens pipiens]
MTLVTALSKVKVYPITEPHEVGSGKPNCSCAGCVWCRIFEPGSHGLIKVQTSQSSCLSSRQCWGTVAK